MVELRPLFVALFIIAILVIALSFQDRGPVTTYNQADFPMAVTKQAAVVAPNSVQGSPAMTVRPSPTPNDTIFENDHGEPVYSRHVGVGTTTVSDSGMTAFDEPSDIAVDMREPHFAIDSARQSPPSDVDFSGDIDRWSSKNNYATL